MKSLINKLLVLILVLCYKSTDGFINLNEKAYADKLIYKCPVLPDPMRPEQKDTSILISKDKTIQNFIRYSEIFLSSNLKLFHQIGYYMDIGEYIFSFASIAPLESVLEYANVTQIRNQSGIFQDDSIPLDIDKIESEDYKQLKNASSNEGTNLYEVKNDAFLNKQVFKCLGKTLGFSEFVSYFTDEPFNSSVFNETSSVTFSTSYIILKSTDQTSKFVVGDTIFSEESYGYLETIRSIDEIITDDDEKLMIETELTQCGSDISSLVDIILNDKLEPEKSELDCSAGDSVNMYVMDLSYESLDLKSKNDLVGKIMPGRNSSSFGLKIMKINRVGDYIVIEGLPLSELKKFNKLRDFSFTLKKELKKKFEAVLGYDLAFNGSKTSFGGAKIAFSITPAIEFTVTTKILTFLAIFPRGIQVNKFGVQLSVDLGFDATLGLDIPKELFKYKFPKKTLLDTILTPFVVPIIPGLIQIPGSIRFKATAEFAISLKLEKPIKLGYFYSKHVKFSLPFGWYNDKLNNPNPTSLMKIYGNESFIGNFSQFKQIPYAEAALTLTPTLSVVFPDFGLKSSQVKAAPIWFHRHSIQKRSFLDKVKKFFTLSLYTELPVIISGTLKLCTDKCLAKRPLEAKLQVGLGNFKVGFKGLSIDEYFSIPLKLTSPSVALCIPFFDVCPAPKNLTSNVTDFCSSNPCTNKGLCKSEKTKYTCICAYGFSGTNCQESIYSICKTNICMNGGTCYSIGDLVTCTCINGLSGDYCEISPCTDNSLCENDSKCRWNVTMNDDYECICKPGYFGKYCGQTFCKRNTCQNGGTCYIDKKNVQYCACLDGYMGNQCEIVTCNADPCKYASSCIMVSNVVYSCTCFKGYSGKNCEITPCDSMACNYGKNGKCILDDNLPKGYRCECKGYYLGYDCEYVSCTQTDSIAASLLGCMNKGVCIVDGPQAFSADFLSRIRCLCPENYIGQRCQTYLPCNTYCLNGAKCIVSNYQYTCECKNGFYGEQCQIGPCFSNPCLNGGICENYSVDQPAYHCKCPNGYSGEHCETTPCSVQPCKNGGECRNSGATYKCFCQEGFSGITCERTVCDSMPCQNEGNCELLGSKYNCNCVPGYSGLNCEISLP